MRWTSLRAVFLFAAFARACQNKGNRTNSLCKECFKHNLTNGMVSYTDPVDKNFEPLGEGSRAIFNCDTGYHLVGPGNSTCREGQWTGAIPKCEKGFCKCTGNQGYWKHSDRIIDDVHKKAYDHGSAYGEFCEAFDIASYDKDNPKSKWALQPWCYIPCEKSPTCGADVPRNPTAFLWAATLDNVELCYSYENCGGFDYFTDGDYNECLDRGGHYVDFKCTCDLVGYTCKGDTTQSSKATTAPLSIEHSSIIAIAVIALLIGAVVVAYLGLRAKKKKEPQAQPGAVPSSAIYKGESFRTKHKSFVIACKEQEVDLVLTQVSHNCMTALLDALERDDALELGQICGQPHLLLRGGDRLFSPSRTLSPRGTQAQNEYMTLSTPRESQTMHRPAPFLTPTPRSRKKATPSPSSPPDNEKASSTEEFATSNHSATPETQDAPRQPSPLRAVSGIQKATLSIENEQKETTLPPHEGGAEKTPEGAEKISEADATVPQYQPPLFPELPTLREAAVLAGCPKCIEYLDSLPPRVALPHGLVELTLDTATIPKHRHGPLCIESSNRRVFETMPPPLGDRPLIAKFVLPDPAMRNVRPMQERSFATSFYKTVYKRTKAPSFQHQLLSAVEETVQRFCSRIHPNTNQDDIEKGIERFIDKLNDEAFKNEDALHSDVSSAAEYLWTSGERGKVVCNLELCSVLNRILRDDIQTEIEAAAVVIRAINQRRVVRTAAANLSVQQYPPGGKCWRGTSFNNLYQKFFYPGLKYRVPGFLATSEEEHIATSFLLHVSPKAKWCINVNPKGLEDENCRVKHMTYVNKSLVSGEGEYLFAPYSVFTVVEVKWSPDPHIAHRIDLFAACDNKMESEDLPLAPWY